MTDEQIKCMVNRFLGWTLPETLNPDGGITFKRHEGFPMPTGTNFLDAAQAEQMVRHMVDGLQTEQQSQAAQQQIKELQDRIESMLRVSSMEHAAQDLLRQQLDTALGLPKVDPTRVDHNNFGANDLIAKVRSLNAQLSAAQQQIKTLRDAVEKIKRIPMQYVNEGDDPYCKQDVADTCAELEARINAISDAALAATAPVKEPPKSWGFSEYLQVLPEAAPVKEGQHND